MQLVVPAAVNRMLRTVFGATSSIALPVFLFPGFGSPLVGRLTALQHFGSARSWLEGFVSNLIFHSGIAAAMLPIGAPTLLAFPTEFAVLQSANVRATYPPAMT